MERKAGDSDFSLLVLIQFRMMEEDISTRGPMIRTTSVKDKSLNCDQFSGSSVNTELLSQNCKVKIE